MRSPLGLRVTTGHVLWIAALVPLCIVLFLDTRYERAGIAAAALLAVLAMVTFRGQRLTGWVAVIYAWRRRRHKAPDSPSEPAVGATVKPADHVAVRWQGGLLVALIELIPRPFTPTVIVDGKAHTDDVLDTRLLQRLLSVHCPDLEADVVSGGYRVSTTASADVMNLYRQVIGADPAPANRRSWILLRAHPERTRKSAQRRDTGVAGLARYLVASTTRIADQLASNGVDAVCGRSFDDFDHAVDIGFVREKWLSIQGRDAHTAAYSAPAGPDVWWSAHSDHTVTRFRVTPGMAPQAVVLLTTSAKPKTPPGFSRVPGLQRPALQGEALAINRHCQLPIGSAGVLVGETANKYPVYMPFDDVDVSISLGDAQAFAQFAARAAAAGGIVTLGPPFREFAELIGARTGPEAKVTWQNATTYLGSRPGTDPVILRRNVIGTPRHRQLPIQPISPPEEKRYQMALPR